MVHVDRSGRRTVIRCAVITLLVCCGGAGCFRAESEAPNEAQAVSLALTRGLHFDGAQTEDGFLPSETDSDVRLVPFDSMLRITPGVSGELSFEVDHANDADDPVEVTLLQFGEAVKEHLEVRQPDQTEAIDSKTPRKVAHTFSVKSDICAKLCNKVHTVKLFAAFRTKAGKRGPHVERVLELDCANDGDSDFCEAVDDGIGSHPRRDAGSDTSQGGTGATGAEGDPSLCGNGRLESGESCDGTDLGGTQCTSLGFSGGSLFCDPVSCTFDDSMCLQTGPGIGGSGG